MAAPERRFHKIAVEPATSAFGGIADMGGLIAGPVRSRMTRNGHWRYRGPPIVVYNRKVKSPI
jgi:hypothetical protein